MERAGHLERLTNLVLYLLHAATPVTIQQIFDNVGGYPAADKPAARRQRFERDKQILRDEGVEIHVEQVPGETQLGYRIREEDYYLPELRLTSAEESALSVAVAGVHLDDSSSRDALAKLGIAAGGVPAAVANLPSTDHLPILHAAVANRAPVTFQYHGSARTVDPFGLLCRGGAWYLFGWDHLRDERRTYRVDRIESDVATGEAGSVRVPTDFDPSAALPAEPWSIGGGEPVVVLIEIDPVLAPLVVAAVGADSVEDRHAGGSVVLELEVVNLEALRSWVMGMADHARVLAPEPVVEATVGWLRSIAERPDGGGWSRSRPGAAS